MAAVTQGNSQAVSLGAQALRVDRLSLEGLLHILGVGSDEDHADAGVSLFYRFGQFNAAAIAEINVHKQQVHTLPGGQKIRIA